MLIEFFAVKKKKTFQNFPSLLLSGHATWKLQHAKMPETVVISLEKKKEEKRNKEQKKKTYALLVCFTAVEEWRGYVNNKKPLRTPKIPYPNLHTGKKKEKRSCLNARTQKRKKLALSNPQSPFFPDQSPPGPSPCPVPKSGSASPELSATSPAP